MSQQTYYILEDATHLHIEKHIGAPTREVIKKVQKLIQENAESFPNELGGSNCCYLSLTMTPAEYRSETTHNFAKHPNPGRTPTIPPSSTGPTIKAIENKHKEKLRL